MSGGKDATLYLDVNCNGREEVDNHYHSLTAIFSVIVS